MEGCCRSIGSRHLQSLTSAPVLKYVGGRDHHPRELRASGHHAGYDLVQVLKPHRRPIIQSRFRSTNAAYPLLHIDTLNNALSSSTRKDDVDPVLYVPGYSSDGKQSACCHVKCGDVRILAPISGDGSCLSLVVAFPCAKSHQKLTLCSHSRSYRRSLTSCKITSKPCRRQPFGIISTLYTRQVPSGFKTGQAG